jgi:hypothetical protein
MLKKTKAKKKNCCYSEKPTRFRVLINIENAQTYNL